MTIQPTATDDKIWVTVEFTINIGNYENVKIQMGQSQTIGPDDDPSKLRERLTRRLLHALNKEKSKLVEVEDEVL